MYAKIKELADEAIALQNKDRMDVVLREISALCAPSVANRAFVEAVAAETGGKVVTYGEAELLGRENPAVLGGPVGEIVAPSPGADAYIATHAAPGPVGAAPVKAAKPVKKGGAK